MNIPPVSVPTSDDDASLGLYLSTMTALMKAVKSNSATPIQHLLRERLLARADRRNLNRILFAITTATSKKKVNGPKVNKQKKVLLDSADAEEGATEDPEFMDMLVDKILTRKLSDHQLYVLAVVLRLYSWDKTSSFEIQLTVKPRPDSVTTK